MCLKRLGTLWISIGVIVFICLGFWQLNRATEKQQWLDERAERAKQPPTLLSSQTPVTPEWNFRPILTKGHLLNERAFFLDNKIHQHRVGYDVIMPMKLSGSDHILLLNLGWIPRGKTREALPTLKMAQGMQTIEGILYFPKKKMWVLGGKEEVNKAWPRVIQSLNFQQISDELKRPIEPFVVIVKEGHDLSYTHNWKPVVMPPTRHTAYAIQWFLLAGVLVLGWFFL